MNSKYTVATTHCEGWWVGWVEEVPGVNCEARTYEQLMDSLRTSLVERLMDPADGGDEG